MSFSNLGLQSDLIGLLDQQNFTKPTNIQEQAIPEILKGNDVLGLAPTGSGKTAAFVLPIITTLKSKPEPKNRFLDVLVLVPTRELAVQVNEVFQAFTTEIKTMAVFGGVSINPQMIAMNGVRILVATPGRLLELVESKAVHLSEVKTLVLDEADKMLNLGFKEEVNSIFKLLPNKRQNLLFSATLNNEISKIQELILNEPVEIKIQTESNEMDLIQQTAYAVPDEKKGPLLRYLIKENDWKQVLIFTSSIQKADNIANKLRNNGIEAWPIHSKKSQGARTDLLTKFKHKKLRVLVATDLISRGIDIEFLPVVINYDLPRSPKDYIHRIGRTGRADSPGDAISFISANERPHFKVIQKKTGKRVNLTYIDDLKI